MGSQMIQNEANTPPTTGIEPDVDDKALRLAKVVGWTRYLVLAPVFGLFLSAIVLTGLAVVDLFGITAGVFTGSLELKKSLVAFIELADVFLLAVVLYIMSLGLYELFIDDRLPLPKWLEIHTLEDLKEKLVGVVVVVLAVFFLGNVIESRQPLDVLMLGGGIAAVIFALTYFIGRIQKK